MPKPSAGSREEVVARFVGSPVPDEVVVMAFVRAAEAVLDRVPAGRHQALALTELQSALQWAGAGIVLDKPQNAPDEIPHPPRPVDPPRPDHRPHA